MNLKYFSVYLNHWLIWYSKHFLWALFLIGFLLYVNYLNVFPVNFFDPLISVLAAY